MNIKKKTDFMLADTKRKCLCVKIYFVCDWLKERCAAYAVAVSHGNDAVNKSGDPPGRRATMGRAVRVPQAISHVLIGKSIISLSVSEMRKGMCATVGRYCQFLS